MTPEQLGQKIKSKYPQYQGLSDFEVGTNILKKYPQYGEVVSARTPQQVEKATKSGLQKTADVFDAIFGGGKIGELIGTQIAKIRATPEERKFISGPSAKEVAGDVAGIGLTLGGLKGVGTAGKLGSRLLKTGALGAGFGASGALKGGGDGSDVAKGAIGGAIVGAGITGIGAGISSIARYATNVLPTRLMQSALGQNKAQLAGGRDVSEFVLENKRFGTAQKLISESQKNIDSLSNQIKVALETGKPATTRILKNEITSDVAKLINTGGGDITAKEIAETVTKLAPQSRALLNKQSLSLVEANKLRQTLDKIIGDRGFLSTQLPFNKEVLRAFSNILRERVKTLAPEGTRSAFDILSKEIRLRDSLTNKYAGKATNEVLNAFDILTAVGGGLATSPVGGVVAVGGKRLAQSAIGKTGLAVGLDVAGDKLTPILQKLTPAERTLILRAIGLTSENTTGQEGSQLLGQ